MWRNTFLINMLTGTDGTISSKRSVMVFLVMLWSFIQVFNMVTGKAPAPIYQEQLFELLVLLVLLVFGDNGLKTWKEIKGKKAIPEPPKPAE